MPTRPPADPTRKPARREGALTPPAYLLIGPARGPLRRRRRAATGLRCGGFAKVSGRWVRAPTGGGARPSGSSRRLEPEPIARGPEAGDDAHGARPRRRSAAGRPRGRRCSRGGPRPPAARAQRSRPASATLVWVSPPGLTRIPSAAPRAPWIRSISSPSWFDWSSGSSAPARARARQPGLDLGQGRPPVDLGLARAQEVQVRAVQHENLRHDAQPSSRGLLLTSQSAGRARIILVYSARLRLAARFACAALSAKLPGVADEVLPTVGVSEADSGARILPIYSARLRLAARFACGLAPDSGVTASPRSADHLAELVAVISPRPALLAVAALPCRALRPQAKRAARRSPRSRAELTGRIHRGPRCRTTT